MVKCRPPDNRDPRPDEIAACRPYLAAQLELIRPEVVVTLGNFATKLLLETDRGITKVRGRSYPMGGRQLVPTYHPAAALRSGGVVLAEMRADLVRAKQLLGWSSVGAGARAGTAPPPAADQTRALAAAVAPLCVPGDVLLLAGDLGAGKTTFAQGFGAGLGITEPITSPTFTLVRQYPWRSDRGVGRPGHRPGPGSSPGAHLLHADVYRLDHLQEIVDLGLGELVEDGGVALVEWGDAAEPVLGAGVPGHVDLAGGGGHDDRPGVITVRPPAGTAWSQPRWTARWTAALAPLAVRTDEAAGHRDGHRHGGGALLRDDGGSAERVHLGGRAHAELLAPAIEEVCAVSGCTVADIDVIAVDVGPGLFTGLRVGVATAKALAQASGRRRARRRQPRRAGRGRGRGRGRRTGSAAVGPGRWPRWSTPGGARCSPPPTASTGRLGPADPVRPVDPAVVRDDRPEPMAPEVLVDWLVELAAEAGPMTGGRRRGRPLPRSSWRCTPAWTSVWPTELSAPPPLALARLARPALSPAVPPAVRARGWCPTTAVRPMPGSTGSSGLPHRQVRRRHRGPADTAR